MEKYEVIRTLGKGTGGKVLLATEKGSGRHVAIKEIILDPKKKNRTKDAVLKEASILAHLKKHPHVVSLQESFFGPSEELLFIVQDFCDGGSLRDEIEATKEKNSSFSEQQIMQWFVQLTMALHHIHSKKVLHRDLKSPNVFLTKKGVIKIGDFGISRMLENTFDMAQTICGTPCYLSPELCQDMPYSSKADVWALGCLLFEMCVLRYAFEANNYASLFCKIVRVDYGEVPSQYSSSLAELIKQLLAKSPEDRPSAGTVLNLPFVQKHLAIFIKEKEDLQEALHATDARQLLKTSPESKNKSSKVLHRPWSAGRIKSPDENSWKGGRTRCKSAQPMNRRQREVTADEKNEVKQAKEEDDSGEYSDDFDSDDSDFDKDSEINGDSAKKPLSAPMLRENRDDEAADNDYPDDFEDDSEEEVLDGILSNARAAQDAEVIEEEIVEDEDTPSSCRQKLKEQMINVIGEKMFEEVRERITRGELGDDLRPEFERLGGSEMMETCYLVNELFIDSEDV